MADIIQIRRDTAANWTSANPTLAQGEFGFETDTKKAKIGDGTTAWNSLAYVTISSTGNLVAGTNITLSGTISNRLIGTGDVTINATSGTPAIGRQVVNTTGRTDNLALTNNDVGLVAFTGTGNEITGIDANGIIRKIVILNLTGDFIFITGNSANSDADNRFAASFSHGSGSASEWIYDTTQQLWYKIGN